jgi:XTP/dITP diphosphohydrolase
MRLTNKVLLATVNRGKFEEFKSLFSVYPEFEPVIVGQIIRNPEKLSFVERHQTYFENAAAKARLANNASHYPSLADDSGIEINALGGKPGVHSHRYATRPATMTQDQANNERVLSELRGATDRRARFVCTLVLVIEGIMLQSTGVIEGTLLEEPRGTNGFGYDPLFVPTGSTRTFAEMTDAEKDTISHRAKAFHDMMTLVKTQGVVFAIP